MQIDPIQDLPPELREELESGLRKEFEEVERNEDGTLLARGPRDRLEAFLEKHQDKIERGLIAAPGSTVRTRGGTTYDVAEDGSWRRRKE